MSQTNEQPNLPFSLNITFNVYNDPNNTGGNQSEGGGNTTNTTAEVPKPWDKDVKGEQQDEYILSPKSLVNGGIGARAPENNNS
ncbi:MAG: hypothetical protein WBH03_09430 [Cyclobacteriaceae bacterium]